MGNQPNEDVADADKNRILDMLGHQYVALRAEIVEHIRGLYVLLGVYSTILITAMAAGFALWDSALVSSAIFNMVIPALLVTAGTGLLVSGHNMIVIGTYIRTDVEDVVDCLMGPNFREWLRVSQVTAGDKKVMGWENWLLRQSNKSTGRNIFRFTVDRVAMLFILMFLVTITLGEIQVIIPNEGWKNVGLVTRLAIAVAPFIFAGFFAIMYHSILGGLRSG